MKYQSGITEILDYLTRKIGKCCVVRYYYFKIQRCCALWNVSEPRLTLYIR